MQLLLKTNIIMIKWYKITFASNGQLCRHLDFLFDAAQHDLLIVTTTFHQVKQKKFNTCKQVHVQSCNYVLSLKQPQTIALAASNDTFTFIWWRFSDTISWRDLVKIKVKRNID